MMKNVYMDESGSVHPASGSLNRFFMIGIVMPESDVKLKKVYKIFVRKNFERLKKLDKGNKMFQKNGKFIELKGSCFDRKMKLAFLEFFCENHLLKVAYIVLDNNKLQTKFISNKARTFNYLLKLFFTNATQKGYVQDKCLFLQIDERNVRTESKFSLEDYLNQEMVLNLGVMEKVKVQYYDSAQNHLIQIADVFSNILYSNIVTRRRLQARTQRINAQRLYFTIFSISSRKMKKVLTNVKQYDTISLSLNSKSLGTCHNLGK